MILMRAFCNSRSDFHLENTAYGNRITKNGHGVIIINQILNFPLIHNPNGSWTGETIGLGKKFQWLFFIA